jgi:hypothetical protein
MTLNANQRCFYTLENIIDESKWYALKNDDRGWDAYYTK